MIYMHVVNRTQIIQDRYTHWCLLDVRPTDWNWCWMIMTSERVENICLQAQVELEKTLQVYEDYAGSNQEPHLTSYILSHFLITLCCLGDSVRFDLMIEAMEIDERQNTTTELSPMSWEYIERQKQVAQQIQRRYNEQNLASYKRLQLMAAG